MNDQESNVVELEGKEPTKMEMLDQWLSELVFPGKSKDFIQELEDLGEADQVTKRISFYTDEHEYVINAMERENGKHYLGCQVTARKPRAGEDWTRGNDLPDGPFNKETWNRIIYAIVNYELVKLSPFQKPKEVPEDVA